MLLMVTEPVVLLVILNVLAALIVPIVPPVNARLAGAVVTGAPPDPLMPTNASRLLLLSKMLAAPLIDPRTVGEKVIVTTHEPLAEIVPPQVSVSA